MQSVLQIVSTNGSFHLPSSMDQVDFCHESSQDSWKLTKIDRLAAVGINILAGRKIFKGDTAKGSRGEVISNALTLQEYEEDVTSGFSPDVSNQLSGVRDRPSRASEPVDQFDKQRG